MSGHIPKTFIQDLLARTDIISVIESRITLKKAGSNYQARCPFHQEKTPSFTVSPAKQFYHCFGCGANGNAIGFLMDYDRLTFIEAVETLAKYAGVEVPYENRHVQSEEKTESLQHLYALMAEIAQYYHAELMKNSQAVHYLKGRGLTKEAVKKFLIGYAPDAWDSVLQRFGLDAERQKQLLQAGMIIQGDRQNYYDRFRRRIMFPIRDRRGRVIGFGGRVMSPQDNPKYLNSPETSIFHKGRELYGWYEMTQERRHVDRVLVVEGYMDVVGLFLSGVDYAVATLGTATSAEHIQRLFHLSREVIFCFDGDQAGFTAARRALEILLPLIKDDWQPKFMFLPQGEDPDTFVRTAGKEKFEEVLLSAKTLPEFFFTDLSSRLDLQKIDNRASLANSALQYIQKMPANITRDMLMQKLAKMVNLSIEKLNQHIDTGAVDQNEFSAVNYSASIKKSPMRIAIMLLLQFPYLIEMLDEQDWQLWDIQGVQLFKDVAATIRELKETNGFNQVTTAMILEYWRDREGVKHLNQLAMLDVMLPEQAVAEEFKGVLKKIQQQVIHIQIEQLMTKASLNTLTEEEKLKLQQLLIQKQTS